MFLNLCGMPVAFYRPKNPHGSMCVTVHDSFRMPPGRLAAAVCDSFAAVVTALSTVLVQCASDKICAVHALNVSR
jgi:hypothetical protein